MKFSTMEFPSKLYTPRNYMDEDSFPTRTIPRPLLPGPDQMESLSDLDISMTPDKMGKSAGILKKREKAENPGYKSNQRQVRFDVSSGPEDKSSSVNVEGERRSGKEATSSPVTIMVIPENPKLRALNFNANPTPVFHTDCTDARKSSQGAERKAAKTDKLTKMDRQLPEEAGGPEQCTLGSPEYNTTLALRQELQGLQQEGFDAKAAAVEQLKKSSVARRCLEGKIAEGVNFPRDQQLFCGLVSLEVPVDHVLSAAVQEKLVLTRTRSENKKDSSSSGTEGPNTMAFYNPSELISETPFLRVEGLPPLKLQPQVKPAAAAFDSYRKLNQWEA
ncbi:protein phosphatase 1 regulatory subunit 35 [Latimeria chalumnae]|uniref:protein phosphatase 1 regulatory subunit 35 n=1 Tax=Latimeria chalumnae TaxID=7897 RepID=UPI0003C167CC|nr:PREDICTED: protein phosphatase 1 regulatory subunit 35 [Latimeria chalumnae]|eukprot:XP_005999850.1 PREDICTED: protein phosphatase 1 regulatory subunit 35 [Latimeria chalumnae]